MLLFGNKVQCNICDSKYKKFLSYGQGNAHRANVLCPNCLSLERHRAMWKYLQDETKFFSAHLKVLHIAPEQCFYGRFRKMKNLDYTTGDLYSPLADIKFDLHEIPLEDNTYDVVFCNHVLEHVDDDHKCMTELHRVLKPGGFAILQVPIDYTREETYEDPSITSPEDREREFWQKDHVRLFGKDYPKKLEAAGFNVESNDLIAKLPEAARERLKIDTSEIIYVGKK
ncbi:MAG: methyltransferase domain-containing protein [Flavobacteriales bacterium]|nr:methyltransferase domain-containing protein [Flavobacteriales bacterium]